MKKQTLVLTLAIVILTMFGCKPPKEFIDSIKMTPSPAEYKGGKVQITFEGTFPEKYFTKKMTMTVVPVLTCADGQVIKGEPVTYQGEKIEGNDKTIKYKVGGKYQQTATFNYTPSMENCVVTLEATVHTKKKDYALDPVVVGKGTNITPLLVSTKPGTGDLQAEITPDKFQRIIEERTDAQINYLVNQSLIRNSELKNENVVNLAKAIKEAKDAENKELKNMEISSYASPEGATDFNEELSGKRGKAAEKYVNQQLKKIKAEMAIDSKTTAEDWEGFKTLVENSTLEDRALILRVLSMYSDPDQREKEIRNLATAYKLIDQDILPQLRRSKMTLVVNVVGKSDEEITKLAKEDPTQLNVEEILYAATLTNDMNEKVRIYTKATELYPNDFRTFNNLGMVQYELGKLSEAGRAFAKALELAPENPAVNYNNGLIALANNQIERAKELFGKSGGVGKGLDCANGVIAILEGNYKKAAQLFGNSTSNNAALANMLNENNGAARKALDNNNNANATTSYLKAILAARTNNVEELVKNLADAIKANPEYKTKAAKDVEFINFLENATFAALLK